MRQEAHKRYGPIDNFRCWGRPLIYSKGNFFPVSFPIACSISLPLEKTAGASSGDFLTMEIEPVGHVDTQSAQPMHLSLLMAVRSFSICMAPTWQRSTQVPQVVQ